ncbi:RNA recognition motif domain-containing protein [Gloeothece verrucosa]|uniref:RNP-1 like RNA-binding protein n=1 Tax=Gloeothece verrucosa (strain PCC 7822) TaxID=497965 RepID=E0UGT5_GLOV7|nr:RNA-binding protein [Gloeothece verrucosa]ADN14416.1 RNP-1 like RNA-binding protein [Gloeothece verrucosa PCC 7822]
MSIYVGNLPYQVTQDDIKEVFGEYGTVKQVKLPIDRESGRVRGFAFVDLDSDAEETKAIEALDGAEWMGRELKVSKARPRQDKRPSSGGSFNKGGYSGGGGSRGGGGAGGGGGRRY